MMNRMRLSLGSARGIAALGLIALVAGCETTTAPVVVVEPHVSANVNGTAWASNYAVAVAIGDLYSQSGVLEIVGLEINGATGRQVTLVLKGFAGTGDYTLGDAASSGSTAFYIESPDLNASPAIRDQQDVWYHTRSAAAGVVRVTRYEGWEIEGTFSFEGATDAGTPQVVSITNGSFKGRIVPGT